MGYSFRLTARVLLYAPSQRQDSTAFVTPVVEHWLEREIANISQELTDISSGHLREVLLPESEFLLSEVGEIFRLVCNRQVAVIKEVIADPRRITELKNWLVLWGGVSGSGEGNILII